MSNLDTPSADFRGVRVLKWMFGVAGLSLIVSAATGVSSYRASPGQAVITYHTWPSRLLALALTALYFGLAYGLHIRSMRAWYCGFALLIANYVWLLQSIWRNVENAPAGLRMVVMTFVLLGGLAVTIYWWRWWQRQQGYFSGGTNGA